MTGFDAVIYLAWLCTFPVFAVVFYSMGATKLGALLGGLAFPLALAVIVMRSHLKGE